MRLTATRSSITSGGGAVLDPIIQEDPTLDLNFADSKALRDDVDSNNPVTFTRASSATYVGADGLIKTTPVNLLTYSEEFNNSIWTKQTSVALTPNSIAAPDGTTTGTLYSISASTQRAIDQSISSLTNGIAYVFSIYIKAIVDTTVTIRTNNVAAVVDVPVLVTDGWKRIQLDFTKGSSMVGLGFFDASGSTGNRFYVWGAQLEEGTTATNYIPTTSTISGTPRFDHDLATGESLGLLIEEARTNHISNERVTLSAGNTPITFTPNAFTAPDGSNTAIRVQGTSGYVNIQTGKSSVPAGSTLTASFYIYSDVELPNCRARVTYGSGNFDTIKAVPAGKWTRFVCTAKVDDTGTDTDFSFRPLTAINSFGVNPVDCYLWGFQVEVGSFATSYIATTTSPATRAADVCTITNSNIYDTDSFTIINQPFGASAGSSTLTLFDGPDPIKRVTVFSTDLSQARINTAVGKTDEFWQWRVLGSSFTLPGFTTDGQVTVDWGDGTVETLTTAEHTFSDGGGYHDIGFRLDSGTYFRPYMNDNASHKTKVVALGPAPESMKLNVERAFSGCSNLEAFDATVDTTGSTNFDRAWNVCASLTSFPLIDTSSGTNFFAAWFNCSGLTSFPLIDTSSGTSFFAAWRYCSRLTSFPLIDTSSGTIFREAWDNCSSLADFPANFFDSWTGTPAVNCFYNAWTGCSALTATSVENILNSIDTSGQSAPASGVNIFIDYNAGTGTPSVATAITNLKSRGWTISLNGVAQ